jgi:hypothetical protein
VEVGPGAAADAKFKALNILRKYALILKGLPGQRAGKSFKSNILAATDCSAITYLQFSAKLLILLDP